MATFLCLLSKDPKFSFSTRACKNHVAFPASSALHFPTITAIKASSKKGKNRIHIAINDLQKLLNPSGKALWRVISQDGNSFLFCPWFFFLWPLAPLSESFFLNHYLPQKYLKWLLKNILSLWTVPLSYLFSSPRVVLRSLFSLGWWFLWHYNLFKTFFGEFLIYLLSVSSMCQGFFIVIKLGLFIVFWSPYFFSST